MQLTTEEEQMLSGKYGRATQKAMEILAALGTIYESEQMVPVSSVQIAGVSFDNLGEAGLEFLSEIATGGGRVKVVKLRILAEQAVIGHIINAAKT